MRGPLRLLAIDLGAESGRALIGTFDGSMLALDEVHRFANVPVRLGGTLYWDFLSLFRNVVAGVTLAAKAGELTSLGVDAWGVDFGLLDNRGQLIANPVHYRDNRTIGMLDRVADVRERIYAVTGIQFLPINTLYQLLAMVEAHDGILERAERLLMIADLVNHFLCNSAVGEYTNATTTQCFDASRKIWANGMLEELRIPTHMFPEVVPPGTVLGTLREDAGPRLKVIAPATHDTASAVAATPLTPNTAYLSSGTWSLVGLEIDRPLLTGAAREGNLTNEGGIAGTIRLLKNVMGLWLLQQARAADSRTYADMLESAAAAPALTALVDPDDERFLRPTDLRKAIAGFCADTNQTPPADAPTLVRVILDSLALKYAVVLQQLEAVTGRSIGAVRVVGGGSNNALLCQLTANACGVPVLAGPAEATGIGNLVVQAMALGELASLEEARELVARSFPSTTYTPVGDCSEVRERYAAIIGARPELRRADG